MPALADDGSVGFEPLFDDANSVLEEMVADGAITSQELSRMTIRVHPCRQSDRFVPFRGIGEFHDLTVEDSQTSEVSGATWEQFELDRDNDALAARRAHFLRSIFAPSLASALNSVRTGNADGVAAFADELELRLPTRS